MNWKNLINCETVDITNIPELPFNLLRSNIIEECRNKKRPVLFFGVPENNYLRLYVVLADDQNSILMTATSKLSKNEKYESITFEIPQFSMFERELFEEYGEEFGILPIKHGWLKPVRKNMDKYEFLKTDSEFVHEVAVGPVHAGIIEPGHFRFLCDGENVNHLEIQLGYQHRGIEKLFLTKKFLNKCVLAESVSGDSAIAHNTAYLNAAESLCICHISRSAEIVRAVALELERIGMHLFGLGALCNDVAYLTGSSVFGARRTLVINTSLALCGSRFGRGWLRPGGCVFGISESQKKTMIDTLNKVKFDVDQMAEVMFENATFHSRLDQTGVVDKTTAEKLNLSGMAARASGLNVDIRKNHPFGFYLKNKIQPVVLESGDVLARTRIRYLELLKSIEFIKNAVLDNDLEINLSEKLDRVQSSKFVVSMTEGWRGETVHCAVTGTDSQILKYKIKDPSFTNWFGLAAAVRKNTVSDFPLCNKSFDLSYCGFDL
ncbi:hydrogenase [Candidatus Dependentiae bacterium]|nr:hydrogenase [Candidatus Dependentiae bacterium]